MDRVKSEAGLCAQSSVQLFIQASGIEGTDSDECSNLGVAHEVNQSDWRLLALQFCEP